MRIKEITVKKLFGVFDHTIPLNLDERITILYGLNGVGKTAILRLIDDVFSGSFRYIMNYPFEELRIVGEDGSSITVHSLPIPGKQNEKHDLMHSFAISYHPRNGNKIHEYHPSTELLKQFSHLNESYDRNILRLASLDDETWIAPTGRIIYGDEQEDLRRAEFHLRRELPSWLTDLRDQTPTLLIETQRLLNLGLRVGSRIRPRRPSMSRVNVFADQLATLIKATTAQAQALSQKLDSTFPTRLIAGKQRQILSEEDLRLRLQDFEERRSAFIEAGLLDASNVSVPPISGDLDPSTRTALSIYVEDTAQKLAAYDDLFQKIATFKSIINKRFNFKQLQIQPGQGMVFHSDSGDEIPPEALSSGEQHELVLFFALLFEAQPDTLVLIDEPELSLHVVWEREFLSDIYDVIRVVPLDVIVATHSPQIINDHGDWTVELMGLDS